MKILILGIVTILIILSGCAKVEIDKSIALYENVYKKVDLGDNKKKVLSILSPTQKNLKPEFRKKSEKYMKNNNLYEVYYMRSSVQSDGLTTDDEFTPYIFKNNVLIAIGWSYLGGAKTQAQARPTVVNYTAPSVTTTQTFTPKPYVPYQPHRTATYNPYP